jgi:hypothetical protein
MAGDSLDIHLETRQAATQGDEDSPEEEDSDEEEEIKNDDRALVAPLQPGLFKRVLKSIGGLISYFWRGIVWLFDGNAGNAQNEVRRGSVLRQEVSHLEFNRVFN